MKSDTISNPNYSERFEQYLDLVSRQLSWTEEEKTLNRIRVEIQFESLRDWSLFGTLLTTKSWFLSERARCNMRVTDIPIKECREWNLDPSTGDISHTSGEFFRVQGVRVSLSSSREVGTQGWDQPILTQIGHDGGLLGLLRKRFEGIPYYLIEAKAEPGNFELVQMSPTLQATFSNLKRAHGGKKPRFAEIFENPEKWDGKIHFKQWLSEDGGRLHKKRNLGMMVEVPDRLEIETPPGFSWLSMYQIKQCLLENAWVNPHVRGIIAHF